MQWKNEADVDDYVKGTFKNLGLKKNKDFFEFLPTALKNWK